MSRILAFIIGSLFVSGLYAQIGTNGTYRFLKLPQSPREAALGGKAALVLGDFGLSLSNPALLNGDMNKELLFQYTPYNAGINYGNVQYAFSSKKGKNFSLGVQSFSYGKFTQTNANGDVTGEFSAADFALYASHAMQLSDRFSMGMNAKVIFSSLYDYQSVGLAADLAVHYVNEDESFQSAIIASNIGAQIVSYPGSPREPLPFELQLGLSKQLDKAPFRLFLMADNLQKWDLAYDEAQLVRSGERERIFTFDKLFRHFSGGVEFQPSDKFTLRGGYNYMRQQELKLVNRNALSGFSFGIGFKMGRYIIDYALASYHIAGTSNHLSVRTNLGSMRKNRKG